MFGKYPERPAQALLLKYPLTGIQSTLMSSKHLPKESILRIGFTQEALAIIPEEIRHLLLFRNSFLDKTSSLSWAGSRGGLLRKQPKNHAKELGQDVIIFETTIIVTKLSHEQQKNQLIAILKATQSAGLAVYLDGCNEQFDSVDPLWAKLKSQANDKVEKILDILQSKADDICWSLVKRPT
jgi:hypothetical protein